MSGRRGLLGTLAAFAVVPAAGGTVTVSPSPDAELIELCREYIIALNAYAACTNLPAPEADPLWAYIKRMEARIEGIEPATMTGVVALAEVALCWARQPDGSEDFDTAYTGEWPERVTRAVLRIVGGRA